MQSCGRRAKEAQQVLELDGAALATGRPYTREQHLVGSPDHSGGKESSGGIHSTVRTVRGTQWPVGVFVSRSSGTQTRVAPSFFLAPQVAGVPTTSSLTCFPNRSFHKSSSVNAIPPALSLFETHSHLVRQAATPQHEAISVSFLLSLFSFPCFFAAADAVCAVPRIVSVCSRLLLLDFQCRVLNIPDRLTFCACKPRPPPNQPTKKLPTTRFPGTARRGSKAVCVCMLCAVRY
ncbi:hypothetical protein IWW34DRAFT_135805 [Fusarium oxysporum f. sp. albedinis]|nr:hypothetical protein IWW34DRAFT_135805 [Fusarium oxysporum f. sp. albedinis]